MDKRYQRRHSHTSAEYLFALLCALCHVRAGPRWERRLKVAFDGAGQSRASEGQVMAVSCGPALGHSQAIIVNNISTRPCAALAFSLPSLLSLSYLSLLSSLPFVCVSRSSLFPPSSP